MYWLDIDEVSHTATLHTSDCIHIKPQTTERKGVNELQQDGAWFSFNSVSEAMRFYKTKRLSGEVTECLLCRPLSHINEVFMAKLDIHSLRTGCDACVTEVKIVDTKSTYRRLLSKLLGPR